MQQDPFDKPVNLSLKDFLIRKTAVRTMINERTVGDIINFQFQDARQALHGNKEVELTGFGKFVFQERKANLHRTRILDKIAELKNNEQTDEVLKQLAYLDEELRFINSKYPIDENTESDY